MHAGQAKRLPYNWHGTCGITSDMPAESSLTAPVESTELDIKSILLIDDDQDLADALKILLASRNYVVTTASDGAAGLREVMAFDFDVIVCDMLMPNMPGDMFYLAVQKVKPQLSKRFIFITGHSDNPKVAEFFDRTNGVVLFKPVVMEDLIRMISLVLSKAG